MATKDTKKKSPTLTKTEPEAPDKLPSAFSLLTPSMNIIKNNLAAFLVLGAIPIAIMLLGQGPDLFNVTQQSRTMTGTLNHWNVIALVGFIVAILTTPGLILLELKGVYKETPSYGEAFTEGLNYLWRIIGLGVVTFFVLMLSLVLLIIPFFFVLPRVILASYYLVDRNLGVIEALKASIADYKTYRGTWGVIGVTLLIALANIVPLVGWITASIFGFLYAPALAVRYAQVKALAGGKSPETPIEVNPTV